MRKMNTMFFSEDIEATTLPQEAQVVASNGYNQ